MTQLAALRELAEKVAAGIWDWEQDYADWDSQYMPDIGTCRLAYIGSLNAAKALHEAVLPGWRARLDIGKRFRCWVISPTNVKIDEYADNPARAWLLAIIRARASELEAET